MTTPCQHPIPPIPSSWWTSEVALGLWGRGSIDGLFHSPLKVVPWKSAPQRKGQPVVLSDDRALLLAGAPAVADLDPRAMLATQTYVVESHVRHYLTDTWETTGRTSADQGRSHNRWPLVWIDEQGRQILLGGHHRSMAALIQARMVRCRILRPPGDVTLAVLPRLLVGAATPLAHRSLADPGVVAAEIIDGATVLVSDLTVAQSALIALGLSPELVADRLAMAGTGCIQMAA